MKMQQKVHYYDNRVLRFNSVQIVEGFAVAGPKENDGRFRGCFDVALSDDMFGQQTFEKAERKMFECALNGVIANANLDERSVGAICGGDLLNQIISASFSARKHHAGFLGLYNACATFCESLIVGGTLVQCGVNNVIAIVGSHFSTAERQYRFPLELGVLRSPVTQWTATGVGATMLAAGDSNSHFPALWLNSAMIGRVVDWGILDANNMGAAMAPAACDTICAYLSATETTPAQFDAIFTGDLGKLGSEILYDLALQNGYDLSAVHKDCGALLYYDEQQTYQGGSGAACSALVFNGYILHQLRKRKWRKVLLVATGALMSPTTSFQQDSIPAIAHLVEVEYK